MKWLIADKLAVDVAQKRKGQARIWYSRNRTKKGLSTRSYHIFGLRKKVSSVGSFYVFNFFALSVVFGLKSNRGI